jgi:hypothetical protein
VCVFFVHTCVGSRGEWVELAWVTVIGTTSLVQILVVVATIPMKTLKTEVEKGSMRTALGHG